MAADEVETGAGRLSRAPVFSPSLQGTAADLIAAVNDFRASYGLEPYVVDGSLMAMAQEHSDYQASIGTVTHTRADGSTPGSVGVTENIAGGMNASPAWCISIWNDYWHMNTMVGYTSGVVGAGMAVKDGFIYYTLDVRSTGSKYDWTTGTTGGATGGNTSGTSLPGQTIASRTPEVIFAVTTATPAADGALVHEVLAGQSLWAIATAYNAKIVEIAALNGLDSNNPVIYPGQKLLIRVGATATASLPPTETLPPPTETPAPTLTHTPLPPTATATITPTPTRPPLLPRLNFKSQGVKTAGIVFVIICGIGLLSVVGISLREKR